VWRGSAEGWKGEVWEGVTPQSTSMSGERREIPIAGTWKTSARNAFWRILDATETLLFALCRCLSSSNNVSVHTGGTAEVGGNCTLPQRITAPEILHAQFDR